MARLESKTKGRYERHDPLYHKAKSQGFVARSIFKLEEIDKAYKLIKPNDRILDLGCAPGSWLQYVDLIVAKNGGQIIGIDLLPVRMSFGPHVQILQGDIFEIDPASFGPLDVVLSDMAPNTTGIRSVDQDRSLALCEQALEIAKVALKRKGKMCLKILEGGGMSEFIKQCRQVFEKVEIKRPKGTRPGSIETYVVGLGKK